MSFTPLDDDFYENNKAKDIYIRASFGQRTIAYILDNIVSNCIMLAIGDLKIQICLMILYISIELFTGASIGKRIVKLKIMSLDKEEVDILEYAKRIGFKYSYFLIAIIALVIKEQTLFLISIQFLPIIVISASLFALRKNKLTLYDQLFQTTVFARNPDYPEAD